MQSAFIFVAILTGLILVAVEGTLIVFVIKYRRRGRPRTAEGPQIHGSTRLEVIWTVVPVVILAAIASFVFYELPGIVDAPAASRGDSTTITVEGHQFYWLFRYPNGAVSIDTMIAPANEVVHERVVGLDYDVNHSWWVPDFGPKYDAIPGKVNKTWFKAPAGHLRRALRRAVRHPARAHGSPTSSSSRAPQYDAFIANAAGEQERRPARARRSGRASARSATASTTPTSARRSAATRCSPSRCRSRRCCGTAGARCRPSARTGRAPRSTR